MDQVKWRQIVTNCKLQQGFDSRNLYVKLDTLDKRKSQWEKNCKTNGGKLPITWPHWHNFHVTPISNIILKALAPVVPYIPCAALG